MNTLLFIASNPFLVAAILVFVDMVCVFCLALWARNNGIIDTAYGLAFILIAASTLYNFGEYPLGGIVTALVSIWGLRLALRIHERNRSKPEDFRYAAWRSQWIWFKTRSFFQIFMLQGLIVFLISTPVVFANTNPAPFVAPISLLGICIWIFGFVFESVGDFQLDAFIKNPNNKGHLMESGLWSITRHPNYFGESTMWWGIWCTALPAILPFGLGAILITMLFSPILITFLLLKVSGVPMLEASMQKRPGWQEYAHRVSVFIPWFPKKS